MTDREQLAFFDYSDAKEALYSAIGIARQLADEDGVRRLEARLAEVKAVFRSQFS